MFLDSVFLFAQMEELFLLFYSSTFLNKRDCSNPNKSSKFMEAEFYFSDLFYLLLKSLVRYTAFFFLV